MTSRAASYGAAIAAAAVIAVSGIVTARAQDASPWKRELHAAARLIAGAARKKGDAVWLRAGVEIRLDPGWHTYWRSPGDSGVPPTFDFAGSKNVESVKVLWPAPQRFPDGADGHFNGYVGDVVFPLRIVAKDATNSASLHLMLTYAYCKNVCFPAAAELALNLSGKVGVEEQRLAAAEARVPRRVPLGGSGPGLAICSVRRKFVDGRERIAVELAAPKGTPVDLFVEGPRPGWALPPSQRVTRASSCRSEARGFSVNFDGLPRGISSHGRRFTFTAVSPDDAIEVTAAPK
jgi:DsbC/DsbD-like thiol-disulfide interchange protein